MSRRLELPSKSDHFPQITPLNDKTFSLFMCFLIRLWAKFTTRYHCCLKWPRLSCHGHINKQSSGNDSDWEWTATSHFPVKSGVLVIQSTLISSQYRLCYSITTSSDFLLLSLSLLIQSTKLFPSKQCSSRPWCRRVLYLTLPTLQNWLIQHRINLSPFQWLSSWFEYFVILIQWHDTRSNFLKQLCSPHIYE